MVRKNWLVLLLAFAFVVAACGDDDSSSDDGDDEPQSEETAAGEAESDDGESDESDPEESSDGEAAGGDSSLTFGDEEIALNAFGCFAEEQEAAGSIITFTAQAEGTNAAGEEVRVDFTRFAPGGTVSEADDVSIDVGPLGESVEYRASLPFESVPVDNGVVTVSETTFTNFGDDGGVSEVTTSIIIVC
jgi:hypothetical protein